MRIVHVSDTHLGYSAYRKVDEESGLNQREIDVYRAFSQFIDQAIELKPDLVLHTGDLFDSVRPTNRALSFAVDQILRLSGAGIPLVVIAGNHSTPRLRETGSVFRLFDHLDDVYPVYKGRYERVEMGDLLIHALPHSDPDMMHRGLEEMRPSDDFSMNIAMMHAGVVGLGVFKMNEFNERLVESSYLRKGFDYIALGHYHEYADVAPGASYSGSTERFSFLEAGQDKGYIVLDLDSGRKVFRKLDIREMLDLGPVDASRMDPVELQEEIERRLEEQELKDKIVRMRVNAIPSSTYKGLNFDRINDMVAEALHFERRFEVERKGVSIQWRSTSLSSLQQEFRSYVEGYPLDGMDREKLTRRGMDYLERRLEGSG